jgi:hypothetical protein
MPVLVVEKKDIGALSTVFRRRWCSTRPAFGAIVIMRVHQATTRVPRPRSKEGIHPQIIAYLLVGMLHVIHGHHLTHTSENSLVFILRNIERALTRESSSKSIEGVEETEKSPLSPSKGADVVRID